MVDGFGLEEVPRGNNTASVSAKEVAEALKYILKYRISL